MKHLTTLEVFDKIEKSATAWQLTTKETNTLRLLGEEMVGMTENLVSLNELDFFVKSNEKNFELHLVAKADISPESRKEFVSASSKKENIAAKGIIGKIKSMFEDLLYVDPNSPIVPITHGVMGSDFMYVTDWSMIEYLDSAPRDAQKEDWDGLEKSILALLADDITIGAGSGQVEMIVKKAF